MVLFPLSALASEEGEYTFNQNKCGACHTTARPGAPLSVLDALNSTGPPLWYAGSKFQRGFIANWLVNPAPIRPMEYLSLTEENKGAHPNLSTLDAADVASYLMSLKSTDVKQTGLTPSANLTGKKLFGRGVSCYGCHRVRRGSKVIGGVTGPTLTGVTSRLNPDWIYAFLSAPKNFGTGSGMPVYSGVLTDNEIRALAAHVASFD
ncbi:MAG: c-type cytochrome [Thermodesulfobacteriota bacterium]